MPILRNATALLQLLPATGGLLALDVSPTRVGVAGSDPGRLVVTPLVTLQRHALAPLLRRLLEIADERDAAAFVIGFPLNMDGSEGPACARIASFSRALSRRSERPILLQDERLTTEAVLDAIAEGRLPRPAPGEPVDHYAAAVILADALAALGRATSAAAGPA
jgi:putative Holliday junction resolvase